MINKAKGKNRLFPIITYLSSVLWKNCKWYLLTAVLISAASGLSIAAITPIKQQFFDSVSASVGGSGTTGTSLIYGVIMGLFMVFMLFISGVSDVFNDNLGQKLMGYLGIELNEKAAVIEPICYEDSDMLDTINKAYAGINVIGEIARAYFNIVTFFVPYIVFMGIYLIQIKPLLFVSLMFAFIPSIIGQVIRFRIYSKLERNIAPHRRRSEYYERCIADREYAKETRVLGAFWFFRNLYQTALIIVQKKSWDTAKKSSMTEVSIRFILLMGYIGTILLLYMYLMKGDIGVGAFAAVFSSIDQMFNYTERVINDEVGTITQQLGMVQNFFNFLQFPIRAGEKVDADNAKVELKNVSFKYPNSNYESLKNINLCIENGESIAIVGENGAGKSTIAKLIMGLYLPTKGSVLIGGNDTKKVAPKNIYKNISAVFQQFQKYKMTFEDNVTISQPEQEVLQDMVEDGIKKSGIDLNNRSFTDGINTMLSREFGGVDLSGGQWQKVAIARGLYRSHNMIILDEPTAAIDPIEETKLYKKFIEISQGKTALIVTHRLGSAKIADKIIVMENGEIADCGTHDELMEHDGIYKEMYDAQAKWYVR